MSNDGGEIRLDAVLANISSSKQKERTDGVNDLKLFFETSRKASHLSENPSSLLRNRLIPFNRSNLGDKSYLKVFDVLFKVVILEKQSYVKSKRTPRLLENCAEAMRSVVQAAISKIKSKTVDALVEHHILTLSQSDGTFCQPLTRDYLRNLCQIFEYSPYVENLKKSRWLELIDLCLQGVNQFLSFSTQEPSNRICNISSSVKNYRPGTRSFSGLGINNLNITGLTRQNLDDIFQTIFLLVSAPNSPITERYIQITNAAIEVLKAQSLSIGKINQLAFAIINVILRFTRTNRTNFTQSISLSSIEIISRFFPGKTIAQDQMLNSLKDEMLILIFQTHSHLEYMLRDKKFIDLPSKLQDLLEIMKNDYSKRPDRDRIQLDELELAEYEVRTSSCFSINIFHLRVYNSRSERNWAILQIIGILERLISHVDEVKFTESPEKTVYSFKRPRIYSVSDRLVEALRSDDSRLRLAGLHILPFVLDNLNIPHDGLEALLTQLCLYAADKRDDIRAWALLAIASCTHQTAASKIDNEEWLKLWRVGVRSLAHSSTCRSASVLLHLLLAKKLVHVQDTREDIDTIVTTAEINGPLVISDASIYLMLHLLDSRATDIPSLGAKVSQSLIRWLFIRWKPAEKNFAVHHANNVQPNHILLLIRICLGLNVLPIPISKMPRGNVAQAWQNYSDEKSILDYLLLSNKLPARKMPSRSSNGFANKHNQQVDVALALNISISKSQSTQDLMIDLLLSTSQSALQDWKSYTKDRSSPISVEVYHSTLNCIIVMLSVASLLTSNDSDKMQNFSYSISELVEEILGPLCYSNHENSKDFKLLGILLQSIQPHLPPCRLSDIFELKKNNGQLLGFVTMITAQINRNRKASVELSSTNPSMIDLDDDFRSSQASQSKVEVQRLNTMPRNQLDSAMCSQSFNIVVTGKLYLLTIANESDFTGIVPSTFFDYILSLTDEEFLSSRELLLDIFNSDLIINNADINRVVEHIGHILTSDFFGRCDVTLLLCVDILSIIEPLWSSSTETELAESSTQIYHWIVTTVLGKGLASPEVQKSILNLLIRILCGKSPDYGSDHSIPSAQTNVFAIFRNGIITVKFHVAAQLSRIFQKFALRYHDAIFIEILNNLPSDADWIEGISFRVFVLAEVGSTWPTLLRRCIYHIFETASKIYESTDYATRCLDDISYKLELSNAQELFLLFASQLLYTWLEHEDVKDIPFEIFGFNNLHDLVKAAKNEAIALMVMRGQENSIEKLTSVLDIDRKTLIHDAFTKAIAYSISYDLISSSTHPNTDGENRIRRALGEETFFQSLELHFADIIAVLFNCLDQEPTAENYFCKRKDFEYAGNILKQIKSFSSSKIDLPPNQQPMFKVKYLAAQIQYFCSLMNYQIKEIFTPTMVTSLARFLFNSIHLALGSFHACSVLRKLRVLVAIVGNTATAGYPLEMLLQSLCPFLQDFECVDDTIGIVHYLLKAGSFYLKQVPSFVAGIAVSILWFLRQLELKILGSNQDSQYESIKSTIQTFHTWIGQYLRSYSSLSLEISCTEQKFSSLVEAALSIRPDGNVERKIAEVDLLVELLKDECSMKKLLSRPSRDTALAMLSTGSQWKTSCRVNALSDDKISMHLVPAIWKSCRKSSSKQYQAFAGKILGQAFASSGHVHKELLRESNLAQIRHFTKYLNGEGSSIHAVLNLLQEFTLGFDSRVIGIAEIALRCVLRAAEKDLIEICKSVLPEALLNASTWIPYQSPPSEKVNFRMNLNNTTELFHVEKTKDKQWFRDFSMKLARSAPEDPILAAIDLVISQVPGFEELVFPFIIHLILSRLSSKGFSKKDLSCTFNRWYTDDTIEQNYKRLLIDAMLYLRTQVLPGEKSPAQRVYWLDVDYYKAALAACSCRMFKTALLFVEEFHFQSQSQITSRSRRSSNIREILNSAGVPENILLQIYMNIDDPDLYYGVKQNADLDTVLARFEYEKDGLKGMTFKSAQYDSHIRGKGQTSTQDLEYMVKAFDVLNMSGISNSLLQAHRMAGVSQSSIESLFRTSRKLEQWDIPIPSTYSSNSVAIYKVFQGLNTAFDNSSIRKTIDEGLGFTMSYLVGQESAATGLHEMLHTLAALAEIDEVLECRSLEQFEDVYSRFQKRFHWMRLGRFDDVNFILSCRGTMLSILSQKHDLQDIIKIKPLNSRLVQIQTALLAAKIYHAHGAFREGLCHAASMIDLIESCHAVDVNPDVAVKLEVANALWEQGEVSSSIVMLQALDDLALLKRQTIVVGRSDLLSKIGHQVSVAKLEKPDKIIEKYLQPALKELKEKSNGGEAGQVYHQLATFCDQQLQNPDLLEEIERVKELSKNKLEEVQEYEKLIAKATSSESKREFYSRLVKSKAWLKIDERDLKGLITHREELLSQSLENYLLALIASDRYDNNALRFLAIWLEHSGNEIANDSVAKYLKKVPSMKFATLMNQLTSRLQESKEPFQDLLFQLILRICTDHPYHGMYQIYAGAFSDSNGKDETAVSRRSSTKKLIKLLSHVNLRGKTWRAVESIGKAYCHLAGEKNVRYKSGKKFNLKESLAGKNLNTTFKEYPAPPLTMSIPLSASLDYSQVPSVLKIGSEFSIASGISAPKIIDVVAENGIRYKQLVKGGNDDLRQDAIMEQVFEQVSELLKVNRSTQQRNLSIRTYRVIPLTNIAGVIEFVPNTISLHEYLMPAHERFFPKDLKAGQCRNEIAAAQAKASEIRIKVFRAVTERFHPVMRFFFTERFYDPDEWFEKRLAYVRSTAANSILGHILGLGDRHANNILVDQGSGEIVHIDLGIAFEMGRILPIPETVPFRLTRDIIDGMGISKTEGVFRRCCEFTLEALQKESYSIMSILDVLRYDPLYSWSVSPVRLAKLREEQDALDITGAHKESEKNLINEPGEAARALSGISKKLTKFLSSYATVNDLINQASDERNLALLFAGWAAYA